MAVRSVFFHIVITLLFLLRVPSSSGGFIFYFGVLDSQLGACKFFGMNLSLVSKFLQSVKQPISRAFLRGEERDGTKECVAMCPPTYFKVEYEINPWMRSGEAVDPLLAMKQWEGLKSAVEESGVRVKLIQPQEGLPDMTFCCNAGTVIGKNAYLSKFRHPERRGEQEHFKRWFLNNGYKVFQSEEFFEGGGDAIYSPFNHTLWAGYGTRSVKEAYDGFKELGDPEIIPCELTHPHFYHMDTCFALLSPRLGLWFPEGFSEETRTRIESRDISLISVGKEEANRFICNSVAFGNTVITPPDCPKTRQQLEDWGFRVIPVDLSQFLKSGGACQCLILKL